MPSATPSAIAPVAPLAPAMPPIMPPTIAPAAPLAPAMPPIMPPTIAPAAPLAPAMPHAMALAIAPAAPLTPVMPHAMSPAIAPAAQPSAPFQIKRADARRKKRLTQKRRAVAAVAGAGAAGAAGAEVAMSCASPEPPGIDPVNSIAGQIEPVSESKSKSESEPESEHTFDWRAGEFSFLRSERTLGLDWRANDLPLILNHTSETRDDIVRDSLESVAQHLQKGFDTVAVTVDCQVPGFLCDRPAHYVECATKIDDLVCWRDPQFLRAIVRYAIRTGNPGSLRHVKLNAFTIPVYNEVLRPDFHSRRLDFVRELPAELRVHADWPRLIYSLDPEAKIGNLDFVPTRCWRDPKFLTAIIYSVVRFKNHDIVRHLVLDDFTIPRYNEALEDVLPKYDLEDVLKLPIELRIHADWPRVRYNKSTLRTAFYRRPHPRDPRSRLPRPKINVGLEDVPAQCRSRDMCVSFVLEDCNTPWHLVPTQLLDPGMWQLLCRGTSANIRHAPSDTITARMLFDALLHSVPVDDLDCWRRQDLLGDLVRHTMQVGNIDVVHRFKLDDFTQPIFNDALKPLLSRHQMTEVLKLPAELMLHVDWSQIDGSPDSRINLEDIPIQYRTRDICLRFARRRTDIRWETIPTQYLEDDVSPKMWPVLCRSNPDNLVHAPAALITADLVFCALLNAPRQDAPRIMSAIPKKLRNDPILKSVADCRSNGYAYVCRLARPSLAGDDDDRKDQFTISKPWW